MIERAKGSPSAFSEASVTGGNVTSWPNMSLSAGTTYYFRVRAFVITGGVTTYSGYSPVANATTQASQFPDPPVGLMASAASASQLKLTWQNKASANATGYHVQQSGAGGTWTTIGTAAANANYFMVTGLAGQATYTFRVTSFDATGESSPSNQASGTTKTSSDSAAPSGSVAINSGASATASPSVTLSLTATDAVGVTGYYIATTSTPPLAGAAGWNTVAGATSLTTSASYALSAGTGSKTVYVWYKDAAGNVSATAAATILLDQTAPVDGTVSGSVVSATQINVSWSGFTDADSGVNPASYKVVFANGAAPASCAAGTMLFSGNATSFSHTGLTASTTYFYRVCVSDMTGNASSGATASATTTAGGTGNGGPNATGIKINNDATYTNTLAATANLGMVDPAGVVAYWLSSNSTAPTASSTGWTTVTQTTSYSANVPFELPPYNGTNTVYVWFKNASGVVSQAYSDTIIVDQLLPVNGTASATGSLGKITVSWSGFSDPNTGLATTNTYTLVTATGAAPASCSTGTTLYTGTLTTFDHVGVVAGVVNYYRVCAADKAGNVSTGATASASSLANAAPVANAGPDQFGLVSTTVYFDASGSKDPDGTIVSYAYTFGDGFSASSGNAAIVGHSYSSAGTYTMTLTVTDDGGLTSTDTAVVTIRAATASTGAFSSVKQMGAAGIDIGYAVAVDASGNVVVVGTFENSVNFGGGTLTSAGMSDVFIAKYSAAGTHICSLAVGGTGDERAYSVAVDSNGDIAVTGTFQGSVNFGGVTKTSNGVADGYVAKYSSNCSTTAQWVRTWGSVNDEAGYGVAFDSNRDVVVTGYFISYSDFGGGMVQSTDGLPEAFVAKYAGTTGAYQWAHALKSANYTAGRSVAIDSANNVVIAGTFSGSIKQDQQSTLLVTSRGAGDGFIVKYSPTGVLQWASSFGSTGEDAVYGVAVDKGGNIAVAGSFVGTILFTGGGSFTSAGLSDGFVARFSPMGNYLWATQLGGTDVDVGYSVASDDVGNVVVTGAVQNGGQQDIIVSKYSPTGSALWSRTYGSTLHDVAYDVALDATGNVYVTGFMQNTINFGGGNVTSAGVNDVFLLKLTP